MDVLKKVYERLFAITALIFPIMEVIFYFSGKVFLMGSQSSGLKAFYMAYLLPISTIYQNNSTIIFGILVFIFIQASKGRPFLTKFIRFNIVQSCLLSIVCQCTGGLFYVIPKSLLYGSVGYFAATVIFFSFLGVIMYSAGSIAAGRYPKIPVITNAAKLHIQRGA